MPTLSRRVSPQTLCSLSKLSFFPLFSASWIQKDERNLSTAFESFDPLFMHISCEFTISSSPRKGQCRMYNVMSWTASQSLHNGLCYCQMLFVAPEKEALAPLKSKQALNSKHAHTKVERFCSYARFSGERSNFSKKIENQKSRLIVEWYHVSRIQYFSSEKLLLSDFTVFGSKCKL